MSDGSIIKKSIGSNLLDVFVKLITSQMSGFLCIGGNYPQVTNSIPVQMRTTTSSNSNEIHSQQTNGSPDCATILRNAQSQGKTILNKSPSIPVNKRTTPSSNPNEIHSQIDASPSMPKPAAQVWKVEKMCRNTGCHGSNGACAFNHTDIGVCITDINQLPAGLCRYERPWLDTVGNRCRRTSCSFEHLWDYVRLRIERQQAKKPKVAVAQKEPTAKPACRAVVDEVWLEHLLHGKPAPKHVVDVNINAVAEEIKESPTVEPTAPVAVVFPWFNRTTTATQEDHVSKPQAVASIAEPTCQILEEAKEHQVEQVSEPQVTAPEDEGWTTVKAKGARVTAKDSAPKAKSARVKAKDSAPKAKDSAPKAKDSAPVKAKDSAPVKAKDSALLVAQEQLISECIGQISPKTLEICSTNMRYVLNFRHTLVLRFNEDSVVSRVDGVLHEFSRAHFFGNRVFQDKLRERFEILLPQTWMRITPGRIENTFCLGVSKRRSEDMGA